MTSTSMHVQFKLSSKASTFALKISPRPNRCIWERFLPWGQAQLQRASLHDTHMHMRMHNDRARHQHVHTLPTPYEARVMPSSLISTDSVTTSSCTPADSA